MPIMFNTILREAGWPLTAVRLIRHKDKRAARGRTPYELWRDNRPQFERYQSTQSIPNQRNWRHRTGLCSSPISTRRRCLQASMP